MPGQPYAAGDLVRVRGFRWIVEEAVEFRDCTLLRLAAAEPSAPAGVCRILHPFDRPVRQELQSRITLVSRRRWGRLLQHHAGECRTLDQLHGAATADISLLPFQLEPALAIARGLASRVLVADEVGLGKTIQAGLILDELRRRGWCERALVLTPAGLREQWLEELRRRFGIAASGVDAAVLQDLAAEVPAHINPWSTLPAIVASIDFVKQPEVIRSLSSLVWDLLVVDEAHQVAPGSQRAAAVNALARQSRHVVLLTATPHNGDEAAFRALCGIGEVGDGDEIALFRRTRIDVRLSGRRHVHLLPVRLNAAECRVHSLLAEYARRVYSAAGARGDPRLALVAAVLCKRAFSSAAAAVVSLERRLAVVGSAVQARAQAPLPFDPETDDPEAVLAGAPPAFDDPEGERGVLCTLVDAARAAAAQAESKLSALRRLLRRTGEAAIVFTEYRDTLALLASALGRPTAVHLHGAMAGQERRAAVDAFDNGRADLLLATDAGSEGLNLQRNCRLVVNLELPWNPVRLEQRIGRVDRLGQSRTVHAFNLLAGGTAEERVLARLLRRVQAIRTEADIAMEVLGHAEARPER